MDSNNNYILSSNRRTELCGGRMDPKNTFCLKNQANHEVGSTFVLQKTDQWQKYFDIDQPDHER